VPASTPGGGSAAGFPGAHAGSAATAGPAGRSGAAGFLAAGTAATDSGPRARLRNIPRIVPERKCARAALRHESPPAPLGSLAMDDPYADGTFRWWHLDRMPAVIARLRASA
jgi:hypothetical protein